jgi:hypothetical protein
MYKVAAILLVLFLIPAKEIQVSEHTKSNLLTVGRGRIFFGHQSVGNNVLQGVRDLSENSGVEGPRIIRFEQNVLPSESFLSEASIGRNEDPASKCADFLAKALAFPNGTLDIALMKFCYVDFNEKTNVAELFELYRRTIDSLRGARPSVVIVHCTVPLTGRTPLWKRFIKWLLGRPDTWDAGNTMREEYNNLLQQRYSAEPIFDIATSESTHLDRSRRSFTRDGKTVYALASEYTDDGGHLNQLGRRVVAEEFLRVLADNLALKIQSNTVAPQSTRK